MPIKIRFAVEEDAKIAADLMSQLAEHCLGTEDEGVTDRFVAMLNSPQYAIWVAENEAGRVVGLLAASHRMTLWHRHECAIMEELVVDRDWRGRGIGRMLLQTALEWAVSMGYSEVEIHTEPDNLAAQALYRKMGFMHESVMLEYELED